MNRHVFRFLALLVVAAALLSLPRLLRPASVRAAGSDARLQGTEEASAKDELDPAPVALSKLAIDAPLWLGRRVRFVVQLKGERAAWNPYLTRFGAADWASFEGWPDELFLWEKAAFDAPFTRLFVDRASDLVEVLRGAETYRRFHVVAAVREVFLGDPWLEVQELEPLVEFVSEGTLIAVGRAEELAERGEIALALDQLERAKAAPLPAHAQAELERRIAEIRGDR
jgi:hypothetical protein